MLCLCGKRKRSETLKLNLHQLPVVRAAMLDTQDLSKRERSSAKCKKILTSLPSVEVLSSLEQGGNTHSWHREERGAEIWSARPPTTDWQGMLGGRQSSRPAAAAVVQLPAAAAAPGSTGPSAAPSNGGESPAIWCLLPKPHNYLSTITNVGFHINRDSD